MSEPERASAQVWEKEFMIDNLLVRIHFIIVMIRWTGLAPWEFELLFPVSLASTFLGYGVHEGEHESGFWVLGFRVQCLGFRVQGSGSRV